MGNGATVSKANGNPEAERQFGKARDLMKLAGKRKHMIDQPPPIGLHEVTVKQLRLTTNSKSGSLMFIIRMEVTTGEHAGQTATKFTTFDPDNSKLQEMLFWDLDACEQAVPKSTDESTGETIFHWDQWLDSLPSQQIPQDLKAGACFTLNVAKSKNPAFDRPSLFIRNPRRFKKS